MTVTYTYVVQQTAAPTARQGVPTRDQLREEIRQSLQDAQTATGERTVTISRDGKSVVVHTMPGGEKVTTIPVVPPVPPVPTIAGSWVQPDNLVPPQVVDMAYGFFIMCAVMVVGWPIARAFGRRIERQGSVPAMPPASSAQLQRIEQAVEAMAIEVERISESQRFLAKLQSGSTPERV